MVYKGNVNAMKDKTIVLQNVELPNAELQNVENTKRRITKRQLQNIESYKR